MSKLLGSFYLRILAVFLITGVLSLVVIMATWRWVIQEGDRHPMRPVAISHLTYMVEDIGIPPDLEKARDITGQIPIRIAIRGPGLSWSSDPRFIDTEEPAAWRETTEPRILRHKGHHFMLYPKGDYRFYVSWRHRFLQPEDRFKMLVGLAFVIVLFWFSYLATQRLLRPVRALSEAATRVKNGELDFRVQQTYGGELGALCDNVNGMADSLQELLEAKREMLLAISHELRSPITRAKLNSEFIEQEKIRGRIVSDLDEMESLVGTLIESERLNQPHVVLNRENIPFRLLLEKVVLLWPAEDIQLHLEPGDPVINVDPVRFELLLRNVLANAVRYGKNKPVMIGFKQCGRDLELTIRDQGGGIAAEHLAKLGEAFYRPDDSRQRQTGGVGLGLYLARRIIEAHGGRMEIENIDGVGNESSGTAVQFHWQDPTQP